MGSVHESHSVIHSSTDLNQIKVDLASKFDEENQKQEVVEQPKEEVIHPLLHDAVVKFNDKNFSDWIVVANKPLMQIWRKAYPGTAIMHEYFHTIIPDVTAKQLYLLNVDLKSRC